MRNVILLIIFLIFTFFINVVFFYVSSDYRDFLLSLRAGIIKENDTETGSIINSGETLDENLTTITPSNKNEEIFSQSDDKKVEMKGEVVLGKNYRDVLKLFPTYDLKELELNTTLFDITTEYPDNYIEYYSKELTLYFFPTKTYKEILDIFKVLEMDFPFVVNEVNNFGDNSFYINLNDDINDNVIRIVVSYKGVAFGLKLKKNEYNLVKEKLNILRLNQD